MENANISRESGAENPERLVPQETRVARALLVDIGQVLVELDRAWPRALVASFSRTPAVYCL